MEEDADGEENEEDCGYSSDADMDSEWEDVDDEWFANLQGLDSGWS
jgi:hypothetical protein